MKSNPHCMYKYIAPVLGHPMPSLPHISSQILEPLLHPLFFLNFLKRKTAEDMESFGGNFDEEWESLRSLFDCEDSDDHFLLHFKGDYSLPIGRADLCSAGIDLDTNLNCMSQESSNSVDFLDNNVPHNASVGSMSFCNGDGRNDGFLVPVFPDGMMEGILQLKSGICNSDQLGDAESFEEIQVKRKYEAPTATSRDDSSDQSAKKNPRIPRDLQAQKSKRSSQLKRADKKPITLSNDEDDNLNGGGNAQSASTCSSEEDFIVAHELSGGSTSTASGKGKTNRGPATDPQSLYARRRRERINERLRILQNLVPNGTKVDISTMLEEAAHYVKFLQLQIKLLSSDDLWMYAPIAYNGMDIGLYQKIVPNTC